MLWRLIASDPQAAVNFMTENAQAPWRDDRHAGKLIEEISTQDPAGTAAWAAKLFPSPDGTAEDQNPIYSAMQRWASQDTAAAKAWLDANQQQPWADAARRGFRRGAPNEEDEALGR